jgi:eukaryotic-like serine/threonine-protein kinase
VGHMVGCSGAQINLSVSPRSGYRPTSAWSETSRSCSPRLGNLGKGGLTQEVAQEICVRTNSKAMLAGTISTLGRQYVIGLKVVSCTSGDVLGQEQVQAGAQEEVLKALDKAVTSLRTKLGESLSTVRKYDTPVEQATTPSLAALHAFSAGWKIRHQKGDTAALPLFKQAIELDPNFATAHAELGVSYFNLGERRLASESIHKAFDLRERASERETWSISANYYALVTGELEKATQAYEQWAQAYPRDTTPLLNLRIQSRLLWTICMKEP